MLDELKHYIDGWYLQAPFLLCCTGNTNIISSIYITLTLGTFYISHLKDNSMNGIVWGGVGEEFCRNFAFLLPVYSSYFEVSICQIVPWWVGYDCCAVV